MRQQTIFLLLLFMATIPVFGQDTACSGNAVKAVYAVFEPDPVRKTEYNFDYLAGNTCRCMNEDSVSIFLHLPKDARVNYQLYSPSSWQLYGDNDTSGHHLHTAELVFDTVPPSMYWYGIRRIDTVSFTYRYPYEELVYRSDKDPPEKKPTWYHDMDGSRFWNEEKKVPVYSVDQLDVTFKTTPEGYKKAFWKEPHNYLLIVGRMEPLDTGKSFYAESPHKLSPSYLDQMSPGYEAYFTTVQPDDTVSVSVMVTGAVTNDYLCPSEFCVKDYRIWYKAFNSSQYQDQIPLTSLIEPEPFDYYVGQTEAKRFSELLWWGDLDKDGMPDLVLRHAYNDLEWNGKEEKQHFAYQLILSSDINKYTCTESVIRAVNPTDLSLH